MQLRTQYMYRYWSILAYWFGLLKFLAWITRYTDEQFGVIVLMQF